MCACVCVQCICVCARVRLVHVRAVSVRVVCMFVLRVCRQCGCGGVWLWVGTYVLVHTLAHVMRIFYLKSLNSSCCMRKGAFTVWRQELHTYLHAHTCMCPLMKHHHHHHHVLGDITITITITMCLAASP